VPQVVLYHGIILNVLVDEPSSKLLASLPHNTTPQQHQQQPID
jgi:hypothetical protein